MRRLIGIVGVAVVMAGACANGDDTVSSPAPVTRPGGTGGPSDPYAAGKPQPQAQGCTDRSGDTQALIELRDFRMDPTCVRMTASQGFTLRNKGSNLHNFSIEGVAGIDVDIEPGQENNTEAPGLSPDAYKFFCKYHRDRGMEGRLEIVSG